MRSQRRGDIVIANTTIDTVNGRIAKDTICVVVEDEITAPAGARCVKVYARGAGVNEVRLALFDAPHTRFKPVPVTRSVKRIRLPEAARQEWFTLRDGFAALAAQIGMTHAGISFAIYGDSMLACRQALDRAMHYAPLGATGAFTLVDGEPTIEITEPNR